MLIYLESLGCCRNLIDSEIMLGRLKKNGHEICHDPSKAEVIIVNTCGFISAASYEAVDTIIEMAEYKKAFCKKLIVTGCLPERFKDDNLALSLPEVDAFLGTGAFHEIVNVVEKKHENTFLFFPSPCKKKFPQNSIQRYLTLNYSAYVKISEGCNQKCTYCIIPKIRGIQQSKPENDILCEIQDLILKGVKEIILVGENTTDYGKDLSNALELGELLEQISKKADKVRKKYLISKKKFDQKQTNTNIKNNTLKTNIIWIRLLYTHPCSLDFKTIKAISNFDNICTYYDVPIQHASSRILKKMGRNYTIEDLYSLFETIRKIDSNAVLRTTLITGFPGETEKDFQILFKFIKDIKFNHLGVFTYSDSNDLKSHFLKNHISKKTGIKRHDIIMKEQRKISKEINKKYLNKCYKVLIEKKLEDGIYLGRTMFQSPEVDGCTFVYEQNLEIGSFTDVKITGTYEYDLVGEIVNYSEYKS